MIKGDDALTKTSSFETKWDEQNRYRHFSQPGETVIRMHMYQFKLTKS